jgi:hypothetical protein
MADSKIFTALLKLSAKLDGSFKASINKAAQSLERLDRLANKMGHSGSDGFNKMGNSASRAFSRIEHGADRAHSKIKSLFDGLGFGLGFGAGSALFGAVERAAGMIGEGSNIAAERQGIRTQLHTVLSNQGRGDFTALLDSQMRTYSDMESLFRYNTVAGSAAQMLVSKYKPEQILPEMRKLGELAATDDQFKLVTDIFSQGQNMDTSPRVF